MEHGAVELSVGGGDGNVRNDGTYPGEAGALGIEAAVKKITSDTASIWGIRDRGLLQAGYVADITIFDADTIARGDAQVLSSAPVVAEAMSYVMDDLRQAGAAH